MFYRSKRLIAVYTVRDFFSLDVRKVIVAEGLFLLQTLHQFELFDSGIPTLTLANMVYEIFSAEATAIRRLVSIHTMTTVTRT